MTAYINGLILTVVVCQAASMLAPEGESAKRYIRIVCALVTLLTILSPVKTLIGHAGEIGQSFRNFFTAAQTAEEGTPRDSLQSAAYTILTYAEERYGFDTEDAEVTFFTDDAGEVTELMLFFPSGNAFDRDRLQAELEDELEITVHIFLERRDNDGGGG